MRSIRVLESFLIPLPKYFRKGCSLRKIKINSIILSENRAVYVKAWKTMGNPEYARNFSKILPAKDAFCMQNYEGKLR